MYSATAPSGDSPRPAADAVVERAEVFLVVGVVEAEHRLEVHGALEAGRHAPADALRRRLRCDELGVRRFERAQLVHQRVVLTVGELRRVQDPVALVVIAHQAPQFLDALRRMGHRHGRLSGRAR
jgi:hypothetical protein